MTGLAPKSFYQLAADSSRIPAHYEGLPVDVVAAAVVATSASSARYIGRLTLPIIMQMMVIHLMRSLIGLNRRVTQ